MKNYFGIWIEKTEEHFKIRESLVIQRIMTIISAGILLGLILEFHMTLQAGYDKYRENWISELYDCYEFEASHNLQQEISQKGSTSSVPNHGEAYSSFLSELQKEYGFEILGITAMKIYEDKKLIILSYGKNDLIDYTYYVPEELLEQGRVYKGEKEAILVSGPTPYIGGNVTLEDAEGKTLQLNIVGQTKLNSYIDFFSANHMGMEGIFNTWDGVNKTVLLVHPDCTLNQTSFYNELYTGLLIRGVDGILYNKLSGYGTLTPMTLVLNEVNNSFFRNCIVLGILFLLYISVLLLRTRFYGIKDMWGIIGIVNLFMNVLVFFLGINSSLFSLGIIGTVIISCLPGIILARVN